MFIQHKATAPQRERSGLTSTFLLHAPDPVPSSLMVTWVDIVPGSEQRHHHHIAEQVYVIVSGNGRIHINNHAQPVTTGDLIYIPSNATHGITNTGSETLTYISAATPSQDIAPVYDAGQLKP